MKIRLVIIIILAIFCLGTVAWFGSKAMKKFFVPSQVAGILAQAKESEMSGSLQEARAAYERLVNDFPSAREVAKWQNKVEDLNIKLLFSSVVTPGGISYEIKPGDTLSKIARENNTTIELIKKSNNLVDGKIYPGRKLKVWNTPFNILVDKSQNMLTLKSGEETIKAYIVSTGRDNCTPVGTFKIVDKIVNPTWYKAGAVVPPGTPENILGSRWLGFDLKSYGIHGTTEPQNLGKQVTQGCVRMSNSDVEELYIIVPVGTEVTIVD
jgi:lipoprotein-anchoring transpeptidase ErfK/SrfK